MKCWKDNTWNTVGRTIEDNYDTAELCSARGSKRYWKEVQQRHQQRSRRVDSFCRTHVSRSHQFHIATPHSGQRTDPNPTRWCACVAFCGPWRPTRPAR